jgi:hypothetical protein
MKLFLSTIMLITPFISNGQKQGNIWHFGTRAGLDFKSGVPVVISGGKTGTDVPLGGNQEGTSCISDSAGNLLFYTGGATIWNRNHDPMPNGTGIMGGVSSTQTSIIVPKPGSNNLFFVFTSDEFQNYSQPWFPRGYRYSVIDMCQDSSRGDVLINQKNILLLDSSTEKLAVCEDALGNGYWIMGHKMFSNKFYSWRLTSNGISNPVISNIGTIHGRDSIHHQWNAGSAQGQMKFNSAGTKLALAIGNHDPATIEVFDFDKTTGIVSNFCHMAMDSTLYKRSYGVEFSPDGSKLYAGVNGGVGGIFLYQFDLNSGDCNSLIASATKIFQSSVVPQMTGMQLAPDNKIYIVSIGNYLDCINSPNLSGIASNFTPAAILISPGKNAYSLPTFIAGYKYHNKIACNTTSTPPDSSCSLNLKTKIYPNPSNNILIVDKNSTRCKVTMNLYNMIGQLILKGKIINDGHNEIQLSNLAAGIYYYSLISDGSILLMGKVLKQ